jgi:sugar phosphate isomerase/epimerase
MDAQTLGRDDIICSYFTLAGSMTGPIEPFTDRIAAAATAGFAGLGMLLRDYQDASSSGLSDADLRKIVDDLDVCVPEVEFLSGWWLDGEEGAAARESESQLLHMADLFGARHLNVRAGARSDSQADIEDAASMFAGLCDRAADHGLLVAMEFMGISEIKDVGAANELVRLADRANGGLVIDAYHYFRSTSTEEDLREVASDQVNCIQLSDLIGEGEWSLEETTQRRMPCGEGDLDLVGLINVLDEMGSVAPASVEILSLDFWKLPLAERASAAFSSTRALLNNAR